MSIPDTLASPRVRRCEALRRGWRRRCPQCGEGALFRRGLQFHQRCSECDLLYQRNYGDTWIFMIITDRIPIGFGVILVYFGWRSTSLWTLALFALAVALPLLVTLRQRQGVALALDYLSRVYFHDSTDEIHGGRRVVRM